MRTVKNRKRKFALGMKIAAMFSCIAIASVGFAAWIIVYDTQNVHSVGSITASTVSEQGLTMEVGASSGKIVLDAPDGATTGWLISDVAGDKIENLSVTIPVTCTVLNVTSATINVDLWAAVNSVYGAEETEINGRLSSLISAKYVTVTVEIASTSNGANIATSSGLYDTGDGKYEASYDITFGSGDFVLDGDKKTTFYVRVKFAWGDKFKTTIGDDTKNYNPYTYYNAITDPSVTQMGDARDTLTAIYEKTMGGTPDNPDDDLYYHLVISATNIATTPNA